MLKPVLVISPDPDQYMRSNPGLVSGAGERGRSFLDPKSDSLIGGTDRTWIIVSRTTNGLLVIQDKTLLCAKGNCSLKATSLGVSLQSAFGRTKGGSSEKAGSCMYLPSLFTLQHSDLHTCLLTYFDYHPAVIILNSARAVIPQAVATTTPNLPERNRFNYFDFGVGNNSRYK